MVSIELARVTFSYEGAERPLFADFSLKIAAGEWVTLVGPSGAGKTTLVKLMKGLLQPQAGEVRINGAVIPAGDLNHSAACVLANPENQIVSPVVAEDVAFGLENGGFDPESVRFRVEETLRLVGLWERARDLSHHLSGGEQQLLILAGALALGRGCLLLDDPLGMVGGGSRAEMLDLLGRINREDSCTLVHTTHLLDEALTAQRLLAIEGGRLLFDGPPRLFLQEKPLLDRLGLEVPEIAEVGGLLADSGLVGAREAATLEQLLGFLTVGEPKKG